jgi:hypothetical protein
VPLGGVAGVAIQRGRTLVTYLYSATPPPPSPGDFHQDLAEEPIDFDPGVAVLQEARAIEETDTPPISSGPFGI